MDSPVDHDDFDNEDASPASKAKSKKKRPKFLDPNAPKRPANAFIMFCELQREFIKEERNCVTKLEPGSEREANLANIAKALAAKWKNLALADRKFFQEMFREQVAKYDEEIVVYLKQHPKAPLDGDDKDELAEDWIDPNAPRKPLTNPFFIFCEMEELKLAAQTNEDLQAILARVSQSLATRWRSLSEEQQQG